MFDPTAKPTKKIDVPKQASAGSDFIFDASKKPEDVARIITHKEPRGGLVKNWSASSLKLFETCRWRVYLQRVMKIASPQSDAASRGELIHKQAEDYVRGEIGELPDTLTKFDNKFRGEFEYMREQYAESKVEVEGEWAFDIDWTPVAWMTSPVWAMMKLDILHWEDETCAKVVDYKSGKKWGNEITHAGQGLIYAIGSFMRFPELQYLEVFMWYIDEATKSIPMKYSRAAAMRHLPRLNDRAITMTSAVKEDFVATPSSHNCKWCPYSKDKTCEYRAEQF